MLYLILRNIFFWKRRFILTVELLEKNLEEKKEKLKLSDLRNTVSQKIIISLQGPIL